MTRSSRPVASAWRAGLVRYAIAVPSGAATWWLTVRDRRMVMATAKAPARPARTKTAPAPAFWASAPAAAVPAEVPLTTAVESQANASAGFPPPTSQQR
jgi:hypothetical protein